MENLKGKIMYLEILINEDGIVETNREIYKEDFEYLLSLYDKSRIINDGLHFHHADEKYILISKYYGEVFKILFIFNTKLKKEIIKDIMENRDKDNFVFKLLSKYLDIYENLI
jgi:hypothetical protein